MQHLGLKRVPAVEVPLLCFGERVFSVITNFGTCMSLEMIEGSQIVPHLPRLATMASKIDEPTEIKGNADDCISGDDCECSTGLTVA